MLKSKKTIIGILLLGLLIYLIAPKPKLIDNYSYSTAVFDAKGRLLRLTLSMDDKYRVYIPYDNIPKYSKDALILYEDNYFYYHPGVNPISMTRALIDMAAGGRKQGASTITMQLARIVFDIDSSNVMGKIEQILRALQIEMFYSKKEILEAYFNLSPYGSNIEGIGAASLIYFQTRAKDLNLQQAISLTVVPQNPSKRNLGTPQGIEEVKKASERLKEMWKAQYDIPENSYLDLPLYVDKKLPFHAEHFVQSVQNGRYGEIFTTLDLDYQNLLEEIVHRYVKEYNHIGVYNASAMIVNYKTMDIKAYLGSNNFFDNEIQGQVDGTKALRSPGSALKPFIYAVALDEGIIHPLTMLKDVPRNYGLYTPENFDRSFYGLVSATSALVYSRNIPAVDLLQNTKKDAFYNILKESGVRKLKSSDYYGLALALGGFEVSLQDIAKLYSMLGNLGEMKELKFLKDYPETKTKRLLSKEASFLTLDMLSYNEQIDKSKVPFAVKRKSYPVYWKTGTSYGHKDALTAGIVGDYVVVVWIGNFDGTPNNAFVGRNIAAPLFFKIVRALAKYDPVPTEDKSVGLNLAKVDICRSTGDLANQYCKSTVKSYFIPGVSSIKMSNVTRVIPINIVTGKRACRHTPPLTRLEAYEFWPSDVLKVYREAGVSIKRPPEFMEDCQMIDTFNKGRAPTIVLPAKNSTYLVRSHKLKDEKIAFRASTDSDATKVYWFMNNHLIGSSNADEVLEVSAEIGEFTVQATDDMGRSSSTNIKIKLVD